LLLEDDAAVRVQSGRALVSWALWAAQLVASDGCMNVPNERRSVESDEETFIDQHGRSLHLVGADVWNEQERLLLTIQPADQSGKKKPQGRDVDDGGSLHQRPMRTRRRSAESWGTTRMNFGLLRIVLDVGEQYNIVNEQELLTAGRGLAAYVADEKPKHVRGAA
jgi:hypothetical protein